MKKNGNGYSGGTHMQITTKNNKSNAPCRLSLRLLLVTMIVAAVSTGSALAQEWRIEPIVRVGGELDDNATLDIRTDEEIELEGFLVDLKADVSYRSPKTSFFVQPRFLLRNYPDEPEFDSDDIFIRTRYGYTGSSNDLGFRFNYDHQSVRTAEITDSDLQIEDPDEIPDSDSGRTLRFGDRERWGISPYWDYQLSNLSSIGAELHYSDVSYEEVLFGLLDDYTDTRLNINYKRSMSNISTFLATITGRVFDSDANANDIEGFGALVGFRRQVSEKARLTAMIGMEDAEQAGVSVDPEVVGFVTLTRNLETIRLFAQYRRSISASGAGNLSVRDSINFNFRRRLSEKISAGLGVRAYKSRDIGDMVSLDDRTYVQLHSAFTWYISTYFSIEADYRYTVLDRSESFGERSNSNRVNLWFTYQPNSVPEL